MTRRRLALAALLVLVPAALARGRRSTAALRQCRSSTARSTSSTSISSRRPSLPQFNEAAALAVGQMPDLKDADTGRRRRRGLLRPRQPARLPYRALHARPGRLLRARRRLPLRAPRRHAPAVPAARRGDLCRHRHRQRQRSTARASSPTSMTAARRRRPACSPATRSSRWTAQPFAEIGSFRGKAGRRRI